MERKDAILAKCQEQEKTFRFEHFSREDALQFGLKLHENAVKKYPLPVAIEITMNGLSVFRCFPEGTMRDNELWLARKRNTVELMEMSSLGFLGFLEASGETMEGRKLDPTKYAAGGGGFPIYVKGTGVIGSICVSGLPDHLDDQQLLIDTLTEWFAKN